MSPFSQLVDDLVAEAAARNARRMAERVVSDNRRGAAQLKKRFAPLNSSITTMAKAFAAAAAQRRADERDEFRKRFAEVDAMATRAAMSGQLSAIDAAKIDQKLHDIAQRALAVSP